MRQLQLFTPSALAKMRDRTASRNYSPGRDEFRREHERHRAWGLVQRRGERLRHLRKMSYAAQAANVDAHRQDSPAAPVSTPPERQPRPTPSGNVPTHQEFGTTAGIDGAAPTGQPADVSHDDAKRSQSPASAPDKPAPVRSTPHPPPGPGRASPAPKARPQSRPGPRHPNHQPPSNAPTDIAIESAPGLAIHRPDASPRRLEKRKPAIDRRRFDVFRPHVTSRRDTSNSRPHARWTCTGPVTYRRVRAPPTSSIAHSAAGSYSCLSGRPRDLCRRAAERVPRNRRGSKPR